MTRPSVHPRPIFMKLALYVMIVLVAGCAANGPQPPATAPAPAPAEDAEDAPISKRIYFFQHKLISKWVFESEGAFYADIKQGNVARLLSAAEDIVAPEYAKGIAITAIQNKEAVLITFPEPDSPPNCYYAIVEKVEDGFKYITYESTLDITDSGFFGVVGGWDSEGGHHNYGPREYRSSADFVADVLGQGP